MLSWMPGTVAFVWLPAVCTSGGTVFTGTSKSGVLHDQSILMEATLEARLDAIGSLRSDADVLLQKRQVGHSAQFTFIGVGHVA